MYVYVIHMKERIYDKNEKIKQLAFLILAFVVAGISFWKDGILKTIEAVIAGEIS